MPADAPLIAFDVGARRIGVAIGSVLSAQARPLDVVDMRDGDADWPRIDRLQRDWRPGGFVVGDPMTQDGGDQPVRALARGFARELHRRYGLPVAMMDERTSSIEAAGRFAQARAQGTRRRRDAALLDAVAAAVILERWLAAPQDACPLAAEPE